MRSIFNSESLQAEFNSKGFVKISLLSESEVQSLLKLYHDTHLDNQIDGGFFISLDNQDQNLVEKLGAEIQSTLEPGLNGLFDKGKIFTASFVIKEPGLKNIVPPHQDWTFVDESEFCSMTVWTPLVDVNENNGALCVIPGSHKLFNHPRSSPSPQSKSPLSDHIFTLFPYVEVIEMKAGEALIFDNRLIHASPPNLSQESRIAVGVGITYNEAQLLHYYQVPQSEMLKCYEVEKSFYNFYNNKRLSDLYDANSEPEGLKLIKEIEREVPELSKEEMEKLVLSIEGVKYNEPLMNKLAKLFNYSKNEKMTETNSEEEKTEELLVDKRSFFEKYSPGNIIREIIWRAKGRPEYN